MEELMKAKKKADLYICSELGIDYDYSLMEYVDRYGEIVPSERVGSIRWEKMEEIIGHPIPR